MPSSLYSGKVALRLKDKPGYAAAGAVMSRLVPPMPWSKTTMGRLGSGALAVQSIVTDVPSVSVTVEVGISVSRHVESAGPGSALQRGRRSRLSRSAREFTRSSSGGSSANCLTLRVASEPPAVMYAIGSTFPGCSRLYRSSSWRISAGRLETAGAFVFAEARSLRDFFSTSGTGA